MKKESDGLIREPGKAKSQQHIDSWSASSSLLLAGARHSVAV